MSLSINDLYPIVVELKDNDHVKVEHHSSSSIVDSYKEKATTAAVSFLSSTLFCGQENAPIDNNPKDYIISKDRMDVAATDRCVGEMGNHREHDHHGSLSRMVASSRNSNKRFNQTSQVTAKQIVFAEATSHPKYRQLDDEYVLTQQIVRCNVATIWECIDRTNGSRYCVKAIDKRRFKSKPDKDTALREISMYRSLFSNSKSVASIPRLYNVLEDQHHYYIVQEYEAGGGNLGFVLRDHGPLSETQMRILTRLLLEAISKLHAQSVCHNDLHLENVLIRGIGSINELLATPFGSNQNSLKFCDLGRALSVSHQHSDDSAKSKVRHSSLYYMAPEVISGIPPGLASDMWSIGIILYVCFCGYYPFTSDPNLASTSRRSQLKEQICQADYTFPERCQHWSKVSRSAKQFISSLLHPDPVVRMTCHEALSHPWLAPGIGSLALSPKKSSFRRKASSTSPTERKVKLSQDQVSTHPLKTNETPPSDLGTHTKKSLVNRILSKFKQKKHRPTKSETDLSTITASSAISSSNSAVTDGRRRHQSL